MKFQRSAKTSIYLSLVIFSAAAMVGCNTAVSESNEHGHEHGHGHSHDHSGRPDSLHEVVEQLTKIEQTVGEAIKAGDDQAAHGPLHTVVGLLDAVPEIAAETDLPEKEWEAVKAAADRLFAAYGVIDKAFHRKDGDKKAAYDQVSSELSAALGEIRSRLPLTGEDPESDNDHDDHHDHEGHSDHRSPSDDPGSSTAEADS